MHNQSIVLGSTGLIGKHLLTYLSEKDLSVIAITRRPINDIPKNVSPMMIDFDSFLDQGHLPDCEHIYICLGTTIKKAGSQETFKKVDLDYCLGFAKKARESGATKISLVTSVGANADSKNFYLKTKGQLENEIKAMGFDSVNIFQPGLLLGNRDEIRPLEFLGQYGSYLLNMVLFGSLKKYRSIEASKVANAMANLSNNNGINYFSYQDFI
tara:strand:- start:2527 stop:3162 length:636 start_codon:yes stop_codon:yes gene_type:complete